MSFLKIIIVITVCVIFAVLIYKLIDSRVTIDHMSQRIASEENAGQESLKLLNLAFIGKERSSVDSMVREVFSNAVIKEAEQEISAGQLIFKFESGRCVSVSNINR